MEQCPAAFYKESDTCQSEFFLSVTSNRCCQQPSPLAAPSCVQKARSSFPSLAALRPQSRGPGGASPRSAGGGRTRRRAELCPSGFQGAIQAACSVGRQRSAASASPRFTSRTLVAFAGAGSAITQTTHSGGARVSEARVVWWRGTGWSLRSARCFFSPGLG